MLLSFVFGLSFISCERFPITDLHDVPKSVDAWPYPWYIYDDELNTKGLFSPVFFNDEADTGDFYPQNLSFDFSHGAYRGKHCIFFDWSPKNGKTWCGFGLATTEEPNNPNSSKDMSTSGYTKLEFYIKGNISQGAKVTLNIPRTDYNGVSKTPTDCIDITTLSNNWVKKTINLTQGRTKANWNTQKFYVGISISGEGSNGATIYIDDIRFVKD